MIFVYQKPLINLLKPVFQIRNIIFGTAFIYIMISTFRNPNTHTLISKIKILLQIKTEPKVMRKYSFHTFRFIPNHNIL